MAHTTTPFLVEYRESRTGFILELVFETAGDAEFHYERVAEGVGCGVDWANLIWHATGEVMLSTHGPEDKPYESEYWEALKAM